MYAGECRTYPSGELGCAAHGQADCLCDVRPLTRGVQIRSIPFPERLLELGVNRLSLVTWLDEIRAWEDSQISLHLVAEG